MDDPGYSTSPLDQPLDDKEPSLPQSAQPSPSSLFDLYDHFPAEPGLQAFPTTLTHLNASSSFVPSDILFPPDAPLSQQERGLMADITLDPDAWLRSFDDASPPNRDAPPPKSPSAPPTSTLPPPVVASATSSVSPSPFAPPSRSPPERDADKPVVGHAPLLSEDADMRIQAASRPTSSSSPPIPIPRRTSKTPLFLPSPSESELPPQRNKKNWDNDPLDIISVTSSSDSPPPRKTRTLMSHVLIPPLPPGARKSDYIPVEHRLRTAAKGKARAGDNSGSNELMHVLQNAFESNWFGPGSSAGPRRKKRGRPKKPVKEVVVVVDDEEDKEAAKENTTTLDQALAKAFTHNSANPNVAASASAGPAVASSSTRQPAKETRAETLSDSASVELLVSSSKKKRARRNAAANRTHNLSPVLPRVSPRRKGKRRLVQTPTTSPRRKRRRVVDKPQREDSDDEVEIVVDAPQQPHSQSKPKPRRTSQRHRASTPSPVNTSISVHTSPPSTPPPPSQQPSSPTTPSVNSLAGLPLTILPAPSRTAIAIPPRALSHLQASSSSSPDGSDSQTQQMQRQAIRQGFCYEGTATGADGLLATSPAAAEQPVLGGVCANTSTSTTSTTSDSSLPDLDFPMDLVDEPADVDADARGVDDTDVVVPPPTPPPPAPPAPNPLLRRSGSQDHPYGPMFGSVIPEHDDADADADTSPERDLHFDLSSLSPCPSPGSEAWAEWRAEVLGGTDASAGEYAGDGTIDPSILGGGNTSSPSKANDYASSPIRLFSKDDRGGTEDRMDDEEEEDVMGMLFQNTSEDDNSLVPPSRLGKGKGNGRGAIVDGVVESPESISAGAASSARTTRIRKPSWRKALADGVARPAGPDTSDADGDAETDDNLEGNPSRAPAISAPAVALHPLPKKRRRATSSAAPALCCHHCRCSTRRPKMHCTVVNSGVRCRKVFCDSCIEKRYPDLTFDFLSETFECPFCRGFCNCSICAPKRGEKYVPERNGGWRSWIARQGGPHYPDTTTSRAPAPATKSKSKSKSKARAAAAVPSPVKQHAPTTAVANAQVFDSSWSATAVFTVTGKPLGNAYLQGNKACIVPLSQPAPVLPPPATTTTTTTPAPPTTSSSATPDPPVPEQQQPQQQQRYVFIGKPLKAWGGRGVSFLDPDPDLPQLQKTTKGKEKMITARGGRRKRGKRTWFFIGNLETLLLARKPRSRRRRQRRSASLSSDDAADDGDGNEEGNPDDVNAAADDEDGVWPGEFMAAVPTIVVTEPEPEPELERVSSRITPEEVERAIGAAFAIGSAVRDN